MEQWTSSKLGKEYCEAIYDHLSHLTSVQMNHKLESSFPGEISTTSDITLMAESEEELKSLLMMVKEEREKVGLKLNIQETKIMDSRPITSWQINGENVAMVSDFIFLGSRYTADGDGSCDMKDTCSLE